GAVAEFHAFQTHERAISQPPRRLLEVILNRLCGQSRPERVHIRIGFRPIISRNNFQRITAEHKGGDALIAIIPPTNTRVDKKRHPAVALEEEREIKPLVTGRQTEAILDFRYGGETQWHLIISVDDTVAVDV